jgi:hypothetical protein
VHTQSLVLGGPLVNNGEQADLSRRLKNGRRLSNLPSHSVYGTTKADTGCFIAVFVSSAILAVCRLIVTRTITRTQCGLVVLVDLQRSLAVHHHSLLYDIAPAISPYRSYTRPQRRHPAHAQPFHPSLHTSLPLYTGRSSNSPAMASKAPITPHLVHGCITRLPCWEMEALERRR